MFRSLATWVAIGLCLALGGAGAFAKNAAKPVAKLAKPARPVAKAAKPAAKKDSSYKSESGLRGTIVAFDGDTITIELAPKAAPITKYGAPVKRKGEGEAPLLPEIAMCRIGEFTQLCAVSKPELSDLKEERWASIAGRVSDDGASIAATSIVLIQTAPPKSKKGVSRAIVSSTRALGPLSVKDGVATLQLADRALLVKTTERTLIQSYDQILLRDLNLGDLVTVTMRKSKTGEDTISQITRHPLPPPTADMTGIFTPPEPEPTPPQKTKIKSSTQKKK